jgi:hypothetical protein
MLVLLRKVGSYVEVYLECVFKDGQYRNISSLKGIRERRAKHTRPTNG